MAWVRGPDGRLSRASGAAAVVPRRDRPRRKAPRPSASRDNCGNIQDLPPQLLQEIFSLVSFRDKTAAAAVCSSLRAAIDGCEALWSEFVLKDERDDLLRPPLVQGVGDDRGRPDHRVDVTSLLGLLGTRARHIKVLDLSLPLAGVYARDSKQDLKNLLDRATALRHLDVTMLPWLPWHSFINHFQLPESVESLVLPSNGIIEVPTTCVGLQNVAHLRGVRYVCRSQRSTLEWSQVRDVLAVSPVLEDLVVNVVSGGRFEDHLDPDEVLMPLESGSLRRLFVGRIKSAFPGVSCLPRLEGCPLLSTIRLRGFYRGPELAYTIQDLMPILRAQLPRLERVEGQYSLVGYASDMQTIREEAREVFPLLPACPSYATSDELVDYLYANRPAATGGEEPTIVLWQR